MRHRTVFILALTAAMAGAAFAETAKEAASAYELVDIKRGSCRSKLETGLLRASMGQGSREDAGREWGQCVTALEQEAQAAYTATAAKIRKQKARDALKEYHALMMTAIKTETGTTREALDRAWARLQLEL